MAIETIEFPARGYIKQGDTIPKKIFTFSGDDSAGIDLTAEGVSIKMQIYNRSEKIIDVSVGNGITIVSAKVFEIDAVSADDNNLPYGKFLGDLEVTDANGVRITYFNVQYTIIKQYTKP